MLALALGNALASSAARWIGIGVAGVVLGLVSYVLIRFHQSEG